MKYLKYIFFILILSTFSGCTISIFNFITNNSNNDLWLVYQPNKRYDNVFGEEDSDRFTIDTDLNFSNKDLKNLIKKQPSIKSSFSGEKTIKIKLPAKKTTYIGNLPHWTNIDSLIENLQIKIINESNQEVLKDLSKKFKIKNGVCNIIID